MGMLFSSSVFAQTTYVNTTMKKQPWSQLPVVVANEGAGGLQTYSMDLTTITDDATAQSTLSGLVKTNFRSTGMIVTLTDINDGSRRYYQMAGDQSSPVWIEIYLTGAWNATESYVSGQPVVHGGAMYIAKQGNSNVEPGVGAATQDNWTSIGDDYKRLVSDTIRRSDTLVANRDSLVSQYAVARLANNLRSSIDTLQSVFQTYDSIFVFTSDTIYSNVITTDSLYSRIAQIDSVFSELVVTDSLYSQIARIDSIFSQIIRSDSIFSQLARIDSIYSQIIRSDSIFSQILRSDSIYSQIARIDSIYSELGRIDTLYSNYIETDSIYSEFARFDSLFTKFLEVDSIYTHQLSVDSIFSQILRSDSIYSNIARIDSIYSQILRSDSIFSNIARIDSVFSQVVRADSIYSEIARIDSIYSQILRSDSIYSQILRSDSIFSNVARIDSIYSQILRSDSIFSNLARIDTIYSQILRADSIYSEIARIDSIYSELARIDTIYSSVIRTDSLYSELARLDTIYSTFANIDTIKTKQLTIDEIVIDSITNNITGTAENELVTEKAVKEYVDGQINALSAGGGGSIYFGQLSFAIAPTELEMPATAIVEATLNTGASTIGTAFANTGYTMGTDSYNYIAFPASWSEESFFLAYDMDGAAGFETISRVIDGVLKRVVEIGGVDYQVWVFNFRIPAAPAFDGTVKLTNQGSTASL